MWWGRVVSVLGWGGKCSGKCEWGGAVSVCKQFSLNLSKLSINKKVDWCPHWYSHGFEFPHLTQKMVEKYHQ